MSEAKTARRVLIIDSQQEAAPLAALLQKHGYSTQTASLRVEADTTFNAWKPDLIVVNIFHRAFSTLDFITSFKKIPGAERQQVVVLAKNPDLDLITGKTPATQAYLTKPVDFGQLKKILKEQAGTTTPANRVPVLVVDEDPKNAELIAMFLESEYYRPVMAVTGGQALSFLKAEKPGAVIMDLLLPDTSGFELIKQIRTSPVHAKVPVVITSALTLNKFIEKGTLTGYPELVAKELSDKLALEIIAKCLEQKPAAAKTTDFARPKVLIADDQMILLELMREMLEKSGFAVTAAAEGSEAWEQIHKENVDIAVLDYDMPIKDGFTLAQDLKADPLFAHLPIIILSANSDKQQKLKGLSIGVDDYLIKPIDTDELVARIRMILKRTKQVLDANPLTHLPGNPSIQARIEKEIASGRNFAVLYLDLNQFKAFNDVYGFDAGDKVIKATAHIIANRTTQIDSASNFIGHIGGDDFIAVTEFAHAEELAKKIIGDFDVIAPSFYNEADRQRGHIIAEDRQGKTQQFPLLSIAIGIVHNSLKKLTSLAQISEIGSELKHHAKTQPKSAFIVDRRSD